MNVGQMRSEVNMLGIIDWNGNRYLGLLTGKAKARQIVHAVKMKDNQSWTPRNWIGAMYTEEFMTVELSENADVGFIPLDTEQRLSIKGYIDRFELVERTAVREFVVSQFMSKTA